MTAAQRKQMDQVINKMQQTKSEDDKSLSVTKIQENQEKLQALYSKLPLIW
ncbi:MAG: hypothetical protein OXU36_10615 [Candidatus Poribacteria bacterium]|nr:hypothetical protein [Candidatus Poribacteria bacterium]